MISPEYVRVMARYNGWQNRQLAKLLADASLDDLKADHGAFFGSILGTLNHVLWADAMWMSRFDPSFDAPAGGIAESVDMCPTLGVWDAERFAMDGRITDWADALSAVRLSGDLSWHSAASGRDQVKPLALCVVHMFNHQAHHRGQVHAMMTRQGWEAPVTDLFLMPEAPA
jgi:uncharacterized damage-inducible protein DinB